MYNNVSNRMGAEKAVNVLKWSFNIYVNDVRDIHYEFDSKKKAETWQENYISDMKKIGCWPIKVKVSAGSHWKRLNSK